MAVHGLQYTELSQSCGLLVRIQGPFAVPLQALVDTWRAPPAHQPLLPDRRTSTMASRFYTSGLTWINTTDGPTSGYSPKWDEPASSNRFHLIRSDHGDDTGSYTVRQVSFSAVETFPREEAAGQFWARLQPGQTIGGTLSGSFMARRESSGDCRLALCVRIIVGASGNAPEYHELVEPAVAVSAAPATSGSLYSNVTFNAVELAQVEIPDDGSAYFLVVETGGFLSSHPGGGSQRVFLQHGYRTSIPDASSTELALSGQPSGAYNSWIEFSETIFLFGEQVDEIPSIELTLYPNTPAAGTHTAQGVVMLRPEWNVTPARLARAWIEIEGEGEVVHAFRARGDRWPLVAPNALQTLEWECDSLWPGHAAAGYITKTAWIHFDRPYTQGMRRTPIGRETLRMPHAPPIGLDPINGSQLMVLEDFYWRHYSGSVFLATSGTVIPHQTTRWLEWGPTATNISDGKIVGCLHLTLYGTASGVLQSRVPPSSTGLEYTNGESDHGGFARVGSITYTGTHTNQVLCGYTVMVREGADRVTIDNGSAGTNLSAAAFVEITLATHPTIKPRAAMGEHPPVYGVPADRTPWLDLMADDPMLSAQEEETGPGLDVYGAVVRTMLAQMSVSRTATVREWVRRYGAQWPSSASTTKYNQGGIMLLEWARTGDPTWYDYAAGIFAAVRDRNAVLIDGVGPSDAPQRWSANEVQSDPESYHWHYKFFGDGTPEDASALASTSHSSARALTEGTRAAQATALSYAPHNNYTGRFPGRALYGLEGMIDMGIADDYNCIGTSPAVPTRANIGAVWNWRSTDAGDMDVAFDRIVALVASWQKPGSPGHIWYRDYADRYESRTHIRSYGDAPWMGQYINASIIRRWMRSGRDAYNLPPGETGRAAIGLALSRDIVRHNLAAIYDHILATDPTVAHVGRLYHPSLRWGDFWTNWSYSGRETAIAKHEPFAQELNGYIIGPMFRHAIHDSGATAAERCDWLRISIEAYLSMHRRRDNWDEGSRMLSEAFLRSSGITRMIRDGAPAAIETVASGPWRPNILREGVRMYRGTLPHRYPVFTAGGRSPVIDRLGRDCAGTWVTTYESSDQAVLVADTDGSYVSVSPGTAIRTTTCTNTALAEGVPGRVVIHELHVTIPTPVYYTDFSSVADGALPPELEVVASTNGTAAVQTRDGDKVLVPALISRAAGTEPVLVRYSDPVDMTTNRPLIVCWELGKATRHPLLVDSYADHSARGQILGARYYFRKNTSTTTGQSGRRPLVSETVHPSVADGAPDVTDDCVVQMALGGVFVENQQSVIWSTDGLSLEGGGAITTDPEALSSPAELQNTFATQFRFGAQGAGHDGDGTEPTFRSFGIHPW